jgi:hypothetical protein
MTLFQWYICIFVQLAGLCLRKRVLFSENGKCDKQLFSFALFSFSLCPIELLSADLGKVLFCKISADAIYVLLTLLKKGYLRMIKKRETEREIMLHFLLSAATRHEKM